LTARNSIGFVSIPAKAPAINDAIDILRIE
jgi:hypothetical protein